MSEALEVFFKAYHDLDQQIGEVLRQSMTIPEESRAAWVHTRINEVRNHVSELVKDPKGFKKREDDLYRETFGMEPPEDINISDKTYSWLIPRNNKE